MSKIIAALAYLCQALPASTPYCDHVLTSAYPHREWLAQPIERPAQSEILRNLDRDVAAFVTAGKRSGDDARSRRPIALKVRRDLRALAELPLSRREREDLCRNEVMGRVRRALDAELDAKIMKIFVAHACPTDRGLVRSFTRPALETGADVLRPRKSNAAARAQARDYLRFVVGRGELTANDWRSILLFYPPPADDDDAEPELWGAALAFAIDRDWAKIGFTETDQLALAQRALGKTKGRAGKRRLARVAEVYGLTLAQVRALGMARVTPPQR